MARWPKKAVTRTATQGSPVDFTDSSGACPLGPASFSTSSYHAKSSSSPCPGVQVSISTLFCFLSIQSTSRTSRETCFEQRIQDLPLGVLISLVFRTTIWLTCSVQNPDEPAKKPTLQSYTIDLNQTGPMVGVPRYE